MLNLKEIWIGEKLQIISSGRVGTFKGIHKNGKARIESQGKIYLATGQNLRIFNPAEAKEILVFEDDKAVKKNIMDFERSLDLHIDKLKPDLVTALPERILDYQIKAFESYLDEACSIGVSEVTIIHGKGKGVLKQSILTMISSDKRIKLYTEINQGGALQLLL